VDYPACDYYKELAAYYPDAKVLLSVRDPEQWFESTQATIFSPESVKRMMSTPMAPFIQKTAWRKFGDRIHDRDFMVDAFKKHNAEVERTIPKDRLLVYDVKQGWEPLCGFLNVSAPSTPFPRRNSREEMAAIMASHSGGSDGSLDLGRLQQTIREHLKR
jgi:Sulfotransferase domain